MVSEQVEEEPESLTAVSKDLISRFLFIAIMVLLLPMDAAILALFWNWFVVPLGPPVLSFWHAFGLIFLLNFLIQRYRTHLRPEQKEKGSWIPKKAWR